MVKCGRPFGSGSEERGRVCACVCGRGDGEYFAGVAQVAHDAAATPNGRVLEEEPERLLPAPHAPEPARVLNRHAF